jgi:DNA polymerase III subunit beta
VNLNIEQKNLSDLLSKAVNLVEKRGTIPILSNVLLSTDDGKLTCTATDMDASVTATTDATVAVHGATTVNAALFAQVVNKLPKGKLITLSEADGKLTVQSGSATFDFATLPAEDFPELASDTFEASFDCTGDDFKRLFALSAFCQSTESTRYYLNGVYLHSHEGHARAVATDGHRLARIDSAIKAEFPGIIVPRKIVGELVKLLGEDTVAVQVSATKLRVTSGDVVILSKTVDGTFPAYERVVPKSNHNLFTANADDMKAASDLVALMSSERTKSVRMSFAGGECKLEVAGADSNKGCEVVSVVQDGEDMVIGFNARYLADALAHVDSDNVVLRLGSNGEAAVIQPEGDDNVMYVVMPVRIGA